MNASALQRGLARVTGSSLGPYQTAVVRIGLSFTWLCYLLREWPNRHELYGPDSPWSWDLARQLIADNHAFTPLMWSRGSLWFETVYALAIVSSALLLLGWRTRTMSVLYMLGVLALQNRSVFIGDGGDNVIHLMALYTVFTRCGQVWSLDARRAARRAGRDAAERGADRDVPGIVLWAACGLALVAAQALGGTGLSWTARGPLPGIGWATALWGLWLVHGLWWLARRHAPGEPRAVLDTLAHLAHNAALLVIMAEVCLIYATAGWYKVQGSRWQDGTALYYPMHLDYFSPWPGLSHLLAGSGVVVLLLSYGTVAVQVAFPFTLLNRRVKNVLLALMMAEHVGIAVLLGLPFFSLAMIVADAVFLPTSFLRRVGAAVRTLVLGARPAARPELPAGPGAVVPGIRREAPPETEKSAP
ncbi:HTTM domain-containing protein [Streptomyces triculaminicus]|uniref:HTTM domain-containing protein n=2 Tax=Streptomyces TaxID=1883 RepID=A0A939JP45_9ACTN|nr:MULTISPECIES: HTTM domain-containing protein [Streptomyces]MBO0652317.1 HTTM domain-containing protein [Streptomyces triculaminicus]QSY52065.1 HTTM domain-containing protein [Streptomyces griseocarneus]